MSGMARCSALGPESPKPGEGTLSPEARSIESPARQQSTECYSTPKATRSTSTGPGAWLPKDRGSHLRPAILGACFPDVTARRNGATPTHHPLERRRPHHNRQPDPALPPPSQPDPRRGLVHQGKTGRSSLPPTGWNSPQRTTTLTAQPAAVRASAFKAGERPLQIGFNLRGDQRQIPSSRQRRPRRLVDVSQPALGALDVFEIGIPKWCTLGMEARPDRNREFSGVVIGSISSQ